MRTKVIALFSCIVAFMTSCGSMKIIEATKQNMTLGRPNGSPKVLYTFKVEVGGELTICEILLGDKSFSKELEVYSLPSGEIIPFNKVLASGNYSLNLRLPQKKLDNTISKATIVYKVRGREQGVIAEIEAKGKILMK